MPWNCGMKAAASNTLGVLLQQSCCFLRVFLSQGTEISSCVPSEGWLRGAGIALDPNTPCHIPSLSHPLAGEQDSGCPSAGWEARVGTPGTLGGR